MSAAHEQMAARDYILHRGEHNPRNRSTMLGIEYLARNPNWGRVLDTFERASRTALRLRQKVVVPALGTTAPQWVVDPDFNLRYHVRRLRLPDETTHRELLDFAETFLQTPLDPGRALWEAVLVEGLEGGRAALLLKQSHAVSDGLGGVKMAEALYDFEPDAPVRPMPALPVAADLSPMDLTLTGLRSAPQNVLRAAVSAGGGVARTTLRTARHPRATVSDALGFADSARRMLGSSQQDQSTLLRGRSLRRQIVTVDLPLAELRAAAKAAGGSLNDAYLAAVAGGLRRYHEKFGIRIKTVPISVPVSVRTSDNESGNQFGAVFIDTPVGDPDPARRIELIQTQMRAARDEPAIELIRILSPLFGRLPNALLDTLGERMPPPDIQASNVPSYPQPSYFAGVRVEGQYGCGPLMGAALMLVLISREGTCHVAARFDTAAITDAAAFEGCLQAGFDEVVQIGR